MRSTSPEPVRTVRAEPVPAAVGMTAHQESFARGLQEGLEEGRAQGLAMGRQEGYEQGQPEGFQAGFQQGFQSGVERVESLTTELKSLIDALQALPRAVENELIELSYAIALRLAGKETLDRQVFVRAVQEALMRLPRPGENLMLRIPEAEWEYWNELAGEGAQGLRFSIIPDPATATGHAFVELDGARVDVGLKARQALVRSALGLLRPPGSIEEV